MIRAGSYSRILGRGMQVTDRQALDESEQAWLALGPAGRVQWELQLGQKLRPRAVCSAGASWGTCPSAAAGV